jgi:hypothetical protein
MTRTTWSMALVGMLGGAAFLTAAEQPKPAQDDLSVVRRAVATDATASTPVRPQADAQPAPRAAARGHEPQWFKVRIVDKASGKKKVTVNMPLALVKALGDDLPVDWPCGEHARVRSSLKVSEVLAALEAGQDLVQVDDEESEVRVWVE